MTKRRLISDDPNVEAYAIIRGEDKVGIIMSMGNGPWLFVPEKGQALSREDMGFISNALTTLTLERGLKNAKWSHEAQAVHNQAEAQKDYVWR